MSDAEPGARSLDSLTSHSSPPLIILRQSHLSSRRDVCGILPIELTELHSELRDVGREIQFFGCQYSLRMYAAVGLRMEKVEWDISPTSTPASLAGWHGFCFNIHFWGLFTQPRTRQDLI